MRMTTVSKVAIDAGAWHAVLKDCPDIVPMPDGGFQVDMDGDCYRAGQAAQKKKGEAARPRGGPGTELKKLFASLGIDPAKDCNCGAKAAEMDRLGVGGCKVYRGVIYKWLKEGQKKYSWATRALAAMKSVTNGYTMHAEFRCNPLGWLLDEAIRRAEAAANNPPETGDSL